MLFNFYHTLLHIIVFSLLASFQGCYGQYPFSFIEKKTKLQWCLVICQKPLRQSAKELRKLLGDFLGGTVVKSLSANAGDRGSIPGPGRSQMPQVNSLCTTTTESKRPKAFVLQQEKPQRRGAHTGQRGVAPDHRN